MSKFGRCFGLLGLCAWKGVEMRGIKRFSLLRQRKHLKVIYREYECVIFYWMSGKVEKNPRKSMGLNGVCADCGGKKKSYHQKWKCSKRCVWQSVDRVKDHSQFCRAVVQLPKVVNISLDFSAAPNVVSAVSYKTECRMANKSMHNDYVSMNPKNPICTTEMMMRCGYAYASTESSGKIFRCSFNLLLCYVGTFMWELFEWKQVFGIKFRERARHVRSPVGFFFLSLFHVPFLFARI